ncbi:MAG: fused MFS/spermidine synthase [Candidatus Obscuribacterales bacterium]|jgi:spermidine synthase|nr:fused MFS/spermidine synthase [Candidatus Obscuribacterales bacterium]
MITTEKTALPNSLPVTRSNHFLTGFAIIAVLFFASGFSSLIYQVVWNRLLVFLFGSTTFATASVLAVFMTGLAAGSYIGGRLCMKTARPLLWYGILEGIVGIWALAVPHLLESAVPLYKMIWAYRSVGFLFPILRLCVAGAVLIIPTACMGATLPLLAKYVSNNPNTVGKQVGSLYAINTFGAVGGAALAGFVLLPILGLHAAICIAAAINIILFLVVAYLSRSAESRLAAESDPVPTAAPATDSTIAPSSATAEEARNQSTSSAEAQPSVVSANEKNEASKAGETAASVQDSTPLSESHNGKESEQLVGTHQFSLNKVRAMIALFGLSGAISMIYEVGWTRALLLVIGSSTYAFTCMLTTFLIGIFLGSWLCARVIDKRKDPVLVFAVIEIAIAIFAMMAMMFYNVLPAAVLIMSPVFKGSPELAILVKFLLAASTFVPLTLGLGATFPAVVKSCVRALDEVGESVGTIYSANTLGAIGGALLAGFVLVPVLGVEKMLVFAAAINMLIGVAALFMANTVSSKARMSSSVIAAILCLIAIIYPNIWDRTFLLLAQPLRRNTQTNAAIGLLFEKTRKQLLGDLELVYYEDGVSATVGVFKHSNPPQHVLITNGNIDGNDTADMCTQSLVAILPLVLRPKAESDCIIGWGTGVSAGASALFPLKDIVNIELEQKVLDASKYFHKVNHKAEEDPRCKIEFNDGRNFLLASDKKYDVIVSEPSNPWQVGVCNLFTKEFFKICHGQLNQNGILSNWAQSTEVSPANIRAIISSMKSQFTNLAVFRSGKYPDIILLASDTPIKFDYSRVKEVYAKKEIREELSGYGITSPEAMLACLIATPESTTKLAANVPVNTDDHNYFEYSVQRTYETQTFLEDNRQMFEDTPLNPRDMVDFGSVTGTEKANVLKTIAEQCLIAKRPHRAAEWIGWAMEEEKSAPILAIAGTAQWRLGNRENAMKLWNDGLALDPKSPEILVSRALAQLEQTSASTVSIKTSTDSRADLQAALSSNPSNKLGAFTLACMLGDSKHANELIKGDLDKVALSKIDSPEAVKKLIAPLMNDQSFVEEYPNATYIYALSCLQSGDRKGAEEQLRKFLAVNKDSSCASRTLGILLWQNGNATESSAWLLGSLRNRRDLTQALTEKNVKALESGSSDPLKLKDDAYTAFQLTPGEPIIQDVLKQIASKGKDSETETLLKAINDSKSNLAAEEKIPLDRTGENVAKLVELLAAGAMLYMLLKKNKKE